jgi:calcineurin-like phosphoesterase family protein
MATFFISDTHFGHAHIITLCKRPFASVEEMDETMISRWNAVVAPGDTVYHLGDILYRSARQVGEYLDRLNGAIHLIAGNHDVTITGDDAERFASISQIKEITVDGQLIVLCHYPMREWNGAWAGTWHLYGHTHGGLDDTPHGFSLDVGADTHDFRPWSMAEIAEAFAGRTNPFKNRRKAALK